MKAYAKVYLNAVVENQGKLFDLVASHYPNDDTEDFIDAYMKSSTRRSIDEGQAYVVTMDAEDLWLFFMKNENYKLKPGKALKGFMPDWIGEFYAYYQWFYGVPSADTIRDIPLKHLERAYDGLHDLDLDLAVKKAGALQ